MHYVTCNYRAVITLSFRVLLSLLFASKMGRHYAAFYFEGWRTPTSIHNDSKKIIKTYFVIFIWNIFQANEQWHSLKSPDLI